MPLTRLTYWSTRRIPPQDGFKAIKQILQASIRNNARDGVTGYMVFDDRVFAQILEGEEAVVARTYARIGADPRHGDLILLDRTTEPRRAFPNWAMGATLWLDDLKEVMARQGMSSLEPDRLGPRGVLAVALALHAREVARQPGLRPSA
ncbi:blue light sensor protein [Alsobacter soli]|uniref:Blue light sensor protein n=1 Tax=Alsobacter soli TaxID=2109933 RepID=A0A2T1HYV9_9HYPH|nr:BLUF domain-containing protein [Alsobacter soli]PSC06882.1 blue light sensor protein [Alsobacter soli]